MANFQDLFEFVTAAEKSRKYPSNTAAALRSALRLFQSELTEEEKESLDTFRGNFEQIFQSVFNKYKAKMSVSSLETYKRRLASLLTNYEKYGNDPNKMATWNRQPKIRLKGSKTTQEIAETEKDETVGRVSEGSQLTRFELPLRPDAKAIILTPADLTAEEAEKIKGYIEFLARSVSK